jgi:hypothetical protein
VSGTENKIQDRIPMNVILKAPPLIGGGHTEAWRRLKDL